MPTTPKPELRLLWDASHSVDDIMTFKASVVYVIEPNHPGDTGLRNPQANRYDPDGIAQYDGLCITAQINRRGPDAAWYAIKLVYSEPYEVDLVQAERMVKLLRKLQRTLDKYDQQFGRTDDLVMFCARVASALGCSAPEPFARHPKGLSEYKSDYRWTDVENLRGLLDTVVEKGR
jgi:hypothetical protein